MGFFDGPLFDFNGNGKLDFHEFMTVTEGVRRLQEGKEKESDFAFGSSYDNDNSDDESNW